MTSYGIKGLRNCIKGLKAIHSVNMAQNAHRYMTTSEKLYHVKMIKIIIMSHSMGLKDKELY